MYGTFPIGGLRAARFLTQFHGIPLYEPIHSYDAMIRVFNLTESLRRQHAPEWSWPEISVSFKTFDSIFTAPLGRVPVPGPDEAGRGDHAVVLTGRLSDSAHSFQFRNSWGPEWGEEGFGYLSREYLDKYLREAWITHETTVGHTPWTYPKLILANNDLERTSIWMRPNNPTRNRRSRAGRDYWLVVNVTFSLADQCPTEVIEVRARDGLLVGWAHLAHSEGQPRSSILKEFFVWPPFRRQGFGTSLHMAAVESARLWGARKLRILFHEMDAQPSVRNGGQRFGQRLGYKWQWCTSSRPRLAATGEMRL
jgi:GNAT superfamily N-acetyltransferase